MQSPLRLFTLSVMALLWSQPSGAQDISATTAPDSTERATIIEHITATGGNTVTMPAALRDRITPDMTTNPVADRPTATSTVSGGTAYRCSATAIHAPHRLKPDPNRPT